MERSSSDHELPSKLNSLNPTSLSFTTFSKLLLTPPHVVNVSMSFPSSPTNITSSGTSSLSTKSRSLLLFLTRFWSPEWSHEEGANGRLMFNSTRSGRAARGTSKWDE